MANEFKVKKGLIVDGSGTVVDIQGTSGQLFSVTDSLTGDLFSVSDVSGIPILNVNSSGAVEVDGNLGINATPTTNAIEIDGADGTSYVHFKSDAATTGARVGLNSDDLIIENKQATGDMIFDTAATERFRIASGGDATFTGDVTVNGGDLTITSASTNSVINLNGGDSFVEKDSGTDLYIANNVSDRDIKFRVKDNGTNVIALTLDGSENGDATFAGSVTASSLIKSGGTSSQYLMADGSVSTITNNVTGTGADNRLALWNGTSAIDSDADFYVSGNTLHVTALQLTGHSAFYKDTINSSSGGESWNSSNGWHRIIEITGSSGRGKCHFLIQTGGGSGTPCRVEGIVNTAWSNANSTLTILHNSYPNFITDIRVVRNSTSGNSFVDIKGSGEDSVVVTILPDGSTSAAVVNFTNVNTLPTGDAMELHQTLTNMIMSMSSGTGTGTGYDGNAGSGKQPFQVNFAGNVFAGSATLAGSVLDIQGSTPYIKGTGTGAMRIKHTSGQTMYLRPDETGALSIFEGANSQTVYMMTVAPSTDNTQNNSAQLAFQTRSKKSDGTAQSKTAIIQHETYDIGNNYGNLNISGTNKTTFSGMDVVTTGDKISVTQTDGDDLAKLYQTSADGFLELFTGEATPVSRVKLSSYGDSYIAAASTARVGIGATSLNAKLQVGATQNSNATGISFAPGASVGNLIARTTTHHNWFPYTDGNNYYSTDTHIFRNANHSTDFMRINSTGVGIGVSPSNKLHVVEGTGTWEVAELQSSSTTGSGVTLVGADTGVQWSMIANASTGGAGSNNLGFHLTGVGSSGGSTGYKMTIKASSGHVGISTVNPRYQLDLAKVDDAAQTDYLALGVNNGPSGGGGTNLGTGIVWKPHYSGYSKRSAGIMQTAEGNYFRSGLAFFTNNQQSTSSDWVERMRLNMDGKLTLDPGAGVASGDTVLDVQGSEGQLFSVTNSLTGSLFSVADVSGAPILCVKDSGYVEIDDNIHLRGLIYHKHPEAEQVYESGSYFGFQTPNATESDIIFHVGGSTRAEVTSDGFEVHDELKTHEIIPDGDSTRDIGTNTVRYRNIYADTLYGNLDGSNLTGDIDLGSGTRSIKKTAGSSNGNHAAIELYSSGTGDSGSAIAIQQQTNEGDTIIFADYEPHVEWGISAENNSNEIHFTAGSSTNNVGSKTFYNNSGAARTAYKKVVINLTSGLMTAGGGITVPSATNNFNGITRFGYTANSAGSQFEIPSTAVQTFRCDSDRFRIWMGGTGGSSETFTVAETGRIGINDDSPDYTLDVNGNVSNISIYASHDIAAYSDARVKTDIKTIPNALDKVNKLRGVTFKRTDEGSTDKRMMGVIAQEVLDIIPEVVNQRESDGHYSVSYGNMVGVLIEAVKELTAEVEELKKLKCKCHGNT